MSSANTLKFWVPSNGSQRCSRKGPQIIRTGCVYLWWWNCEYQFTSDKLKLLLVVEWDGISLYLSCGTVRCGINTADCFRSISTLTRCTNINLFKDEKFILFYIDSLSHLRTSSVTFTSKHHAWSVIFPGRYLIKQQAYLVLPLWRLHMELKFKSLMIRIS